MGGLPALVLEPAFVGRLAGDVAYEPEAVGVVVFGDVDFRAFGFVFDGLECEESIKGCAAVTVKIADGRADLGVGIGGDRFFQEVDQAAFALEDAEEGDGFAASGAFLFRARDGWRGRC